MPVAAEGDTVAVSVTASLVVGEVGEALSEVEVEVRLEEELVTVTLMALDELEP